MAERREPRKPGFTIIGELDTKNRERDPILNDVVVERIKQILGVEGEVEHSEKAYAQVWRLTLPSGITINLEAYVGRKGVVSSQDVPAYDTVRVRYTDGTIERNAHMQGVTKILHFKNEEGADVVRFAQVTDKRSAKLGVSARSVDVFDHSNRNKNMPPFFVRNFSFKLL